MALGDAHPDLVVLTGAGVSVESGLSTFRGPDGLWDGHRVEDVATPEGFAADPVRVQRFYNRMRRRVGQVVPNAAHYGLARVERAVGPRFHLITQNIDDLHQRAGSGRLTPMHGEVMKIRNIASGEVLDWVHDVDDNDQQWRPHVVWFGEQTIGLGECIEMLSAASMFVAIGTSGSVYPASTFAEIAKAGGAVTVELNAEATGGAFDHVLTGPASVRVPQFVDYLLGEGGSPWT